MPAFVRQAVNTQSAGTTGVVTSTAPTAFDTLVCFTYSNAGDVSGAGEALKKFVGEYWQKRMFDDASEQVAAERCSSCGGRGCRMCAPFDE